MRKIFLLFILFGLFATAGTAQEKRDTASATPPVKDSLAPYQKYPTLPAFNILMMDSTTIFNTYNIPEGKKIAIFFFSPDCSHCQRTTGRLMHNMDSISDVQFYMITPVHSMTELRKFYEDYHLGDHKNVKLVGRDYEFFFGSFYGIKYVPDLVLYDEHKNLIKLLQGEIHVKDIYDAIH